MKKITTIGRILFALPFAIFGINHFLMMDYYLGMLTSFIPRTGFIMILTGIMLILASISIITKKFVAISTILLATLLFIFIVTIHIPHLVNGIDTTTDPDCSFKRCFTYGWIIDDCRYIFRGG